MLGVHKSSVSRELKRNRGQRGYRPQQAQELAVKRRSKAVPRIRTEVWATVEHLLRQDWSPEQISGRLKKEQGIRISHEWIYQYLLEDKWAGGNLYKHLRCQKKRRKRYGTYDRRGKLSNCHSIEERPAQVQTRKRIGDWEVDTLLGKQQKHAMLTLTERKSHFTLLGKLSRRTAPAVRQRLCQLLLPIQDQVHTLTSDHGREFAAHERIAETLQLKFYFAHPYAAWERGTNETRTVYCDNIFPRNQTSRPSPTNRSNRPCPD